MKEEGALGTGEMQALGRQLKTHGQRFSAGYLDAVARTFPGFEAEWDADGDAVMVQDVMRV